MFSSYGAARASVVALDGVEVNLCSVSNVSAVGSLAGRFGELIIGFVGECEQFRASSAEFIRALQAAHPIDETSTITFIIWQPMNLELPSTVWIVQTRLILSEVSLRVDLLLTSTSRTVVCLTGITNTRQWISE